jgi:hypothetical protein
MGRDLMAFKPPSFVSPTSGLSDPVNSTLARVVSKCVLEGTSWPGLHITVNRMRSAARPWCVGTMWRNPVSASATRLRRKKLSLPA